MISSPYGPQPLPRESPAISTSPLPRAVIVETPFTPKEDKEPHVDPASVIKKVQFALISLGVMGVTIIIGYLLGQVFS